MCFSGTSINFCHLKFSIAKTLRYTVLRRIYNCHLTHTLLSVILRTFSFVCNLDEVHISFNFDLIWHATTGASKIFTFFNSISCQPKRLNCNDCWTSGSDFRMHRRNGWQKLFWIKIENMYRKVLPSTPLDFVQSHWTMFMKIETNLFPRIQTYFQYKQGSF